MKDISHTWAFVKDDEDRSPVLLSQQSDFLRLPGEARLRALAETIPARMGSDLPSTIQASVQACIHATQEYLTQVVAAASVMDAQLCSSLVVCSSGITVPRKTSDVGDWIHPYPVQGAITHGWLRVMPVFGESALEPAVTLYVRRKEEEHPEVYGEFYVEFSVSDAQDMRLLQQLMHDHGEVWRPFEDAAGVRPSSPVPLPEEVEESRSEWTCTEYLDAFLEHVVDQEEEDDCHETFVLEFSCDDGGLIHAPIFAALSVLQAVHLYRAAKDFEGADRLHARAGLILRDALRSAHSAADALEHPQDERAYGAGIFSLRARAS